MFKPRQTVTVIDPLSPYMGKSGVVVSTATTVEYQAVSVRLDGNGSSTWFFDKQLTLKS